jgi:DNA-binding helix-hairpin-helix protein with protein kinase domain
VQLKRASNGTPISLGEELGSGGEGTVSRVVDAPDLVAKIYFEAPEAHKVAKLTAMVGLSPPELLRIAAWPIDLLLDDKEAVVGFLMQRVSSREDAHELYSPKSRRHAFPEADFRFIVHAAANVARAFAQLHSLGHVIGDVNHGNALIGRDATVMLIDCDSFQVNDGDVHFTCDVGVPLFTPPELQGRNFRGLTRSADHDAFGLAVLLFHLLYAGRHPFAGVFADGEMPIEQAIAESRFAYGANAEALRMSAPPGTLALDAFGHSIAALFERAFAAPGTASRPTAVEWVDAMNALEADLTTCTSSTYHDHPKGVACCWCVLEARASIVLFGHPSRLAAPFFDQAELEQLWREIRAVQPPGPSFNQAQLAAAMASRENAKRVGWVALGWFAYIFLVGASADALPRRLASSWLTVAVLGGAAVYIVTRVLRKSSRHDYETALRAATSRLSSDKFDSALKQLKDARRRLQDIHENRSLFVVEPVARRQTTRRQQRLSSSLLTASRAPALNASERAALLSLGIVTAADVLRERSQLHHALSYAMVRELIQWAESCATEAVADTATPLEPQDLKALEEALRAEAKRLMADLRRGAALLLIANEDILEARRRAAFEISGPE